MSQSKISRRKFIKAASIAGISISAIGNVPKISKAQQSGLTWETATDWDNAVSESGVVHESVANSDHTDASIVKQGYPINSPLFSANLIGYWPFHEDSGSVANDFSANNNDGTINGATLGQTGVLGTTSYSFDGSDDYVDLGVTITGLGLSTGAFTVLAWIIRNGATTVDPIIGNDLNTLPMFWFNIKDTNELSWRGSGSSIDAPNFSVGDSERALVGVRRDSSGNIHFIKNGNIEDSGSNDTGDLSGNSSNLLVGSENRASANWFSGTIQEVSWYNTGLSSTQIQNHYNIVNTLGNLITDTKVS